MVEALNIFRKEVNEVRFTHKNDLHGITALMNRGLRV